MIEQLKEYLSDKRVTKTAFARRVGISKQHLHRILVGGRYSKELGKKFIKCIEEKTCDTYEVIDTLERKIKALEQAQNSLVTKITLDFQIFWNLIHNRYTTTSDYRAFAERSSLHKLGEKSKEE